MTYDGTSHAFRTPFLQGKSWRTRIRETATGELTTRTVKAAKSLKDAKRIVQGWADAARLAAIQAAMRPEDRPLVVESIVAACDLWLSNLKPDIRPSTLTGYQSTLTTFTAHSASKGIINVSELRLGHYEDFVKVRGHTWSGRTKVKTLALLKRFFLWCVASSYLRASPIALVRPPKAWTKAVRDSRFRGTALTDDQARSLLAACSDPLKPVVLCALRTGLRYGNIMRLRWGQLPNDLTEVKIAGAEMKSGEAFHAPVHSEVTSMLRELLSNYMAEHHRAPGPDVKVFDVPSIAYAVRLALRRAGLAEIDGKHTRIHDLRHTYATVLARHCVGAAVAKLLAHAPKEVTDRYVHLDMADLKSELAKVPWLLPPARETAETAT